MEHSLRTREFNETRFSLTTTLFILNTLFTEIFWTSVFTFHSEGWIFLPVRDRILIHCNRRYFARIRLFFPETFEDVHFIRQDVVKQQGGDERGDDGGDEGDQHGHSFEWKQLVSRSLVVPRIFDQWIKTQQDFSCKEGPNPCKAYSTQEMTSTILTSGELILGGIVALWKLSRQFSGLEQKKGLEKETTKCLLQDCYLQAHCTHDSVSPVFTKVFLKKKSPHKKQTYLQSTWRPSQEYNQSALRRCLWSLCTPPAPVVGREWRTPGRSTRTTGHKWNPQQWPSQWQQPRRTEWRFSSPRSLPFLKPASTTKSKSHCERNFCLPVFSQWNPHEFVLTNSFSSFSMHRAPNNFQCSSVC